MTKLLSNSNDIIPQKGTHKTQCVHRMTLQPFVPHEIDDTQVNQKELYPDTDAIEDTDNFDENLPPLSENESYNDFEEPREEIYPGYKTPTFSDVYVPEVLACRAAIQRDTPFGRQPHTLAQSRHSPMKIDEPTDEQMSYTAVPPTHGTNYGDNSADVHVKNTNNESTRIAK